MFALLISALLVAALLDGPHNGYDSEFRKEAFIGENISNNLISESGSRDTIH